MATKIRLSRHGKKGYAFYHIVVADSRAPRDGKFIEKLGTYNPNTNPATIELNFDRSVYWVGVGAQPTDTTRSILSREGVMFRHHLNGGVRKGAFSEEVAEQKFNAWKTEKEQKNADAVSQLEAAKNKSAKERLAAETKVKEAKAAALAAKLSASAAAAQTVEDTEEAPEDAVAEATETAEAAAEGAAQINEEAGDTADKAAATEQAEEAAEIAAGVEAAQEAVAEEKAEAAAAEEAPAATEEKAEAPAAEEAPAVEEKAAE